jgi:hypothetical protein
MQQALVMLMAMAALVAACGPRTPPAPATQAVVTPATVRQVPCDDGGGGGVVIHGVCL